MRIAPEACIEDGLLDVVVIPRRGTPWLIAKLPSLYRGTHMQGSGATFSRGRVVVADAVSEGCLIELDGEVVGTLPARMEILPSALTMICPVR
jgi:diacylglycerol kinase (ATP)